MTDFIKTEIEDLIVVVPKRFGDHRGFFSETYNEGRYRKGGVDALFCQDNHSLSKEAGTVRGLHFQEPPYAQGKLVRCGRGSLFDVAVDIRTSSPTYGKWYGCVLSEENGKQLYVPEGFAHGFMTLEPDTEIVYKCSEFYHPESEGALLWNDPDIGISWPELTSEVILSEKDRTASCMSGFSSPF